jgi:N6-adenosine-specific RNA methylase IME4
MLDLELLSALPLYLRAEIEENVTRKDFTQSELAEIQRVILDHFAAARKLSQGSRTDLTSTKTCVEVGRSKRVENSTEQVARLFGESEGTLRKRLAIVEAAARDPARFGQYVADMDRTDRVDGVYRRLSNQQQGDAIRAEPPPLPTGPFRVIVADPPWPYEVRAADPSHRGICPYPTMNIVDICALPVARLTHDDAILWLWVTNAHLLDGVAQQVLNAWRFEPKTMFTWGKKHFGQGHWLRGQTEHAILATRGKPLVSLTNESTWFTAPSGEHSEKPDEFYALVEALCPAAGYLELFARRQRPGWTCWGDEVVALPVVTVAGGGN